MSSIRIGDDAALLALVPVASVMRTAKGERLLLAVNVEAPDAEDLNAIFRTANSVKGGASTFGVTDMTEVTHVLETLLDRIRKGEMALTGEHLVYERCLLPIDGFVQGVRDFIARGSATMDASARCDAPNASLTYASA